MNTKLRKTLKFKNLAGAYISSRLHSTPAFVRVIPTDRCNLNCKYCWQRDNASTEMTLAEFSRYLQKAVELKVGIVTFLGGEPMIWGPLYDAIAMCSENKILTDVTTNGTLLTRDNITRLGEAGLDYLNISVDGLGANNISAKNSVIRNCLIPALKSAKSRYRMHFRINSVIYKNNFEDLKELIEFSKSNDVQISLGFIVPPLDEHQKNRENIYLGKKDSRLIREIVTYILNKKRSGYPIIDPASYFENIFRFLDREKFWSCNYPTRYGWINVTPNGKIRSCTKKMDELNIPFLDLNPDNLKILRATLKSKVEQCNVDCYSNCAYDSYFYTHHKLQMVKKIWDRMK